MSARRVSVISAFALLICVGVGALELFQPVGYVRLCNLFRDAIARSGRTTAPNPNLVFLAIDSQSIGFDETDLLSYQLSSNDSGETRALRLMSKGWPWSREVYAAVLDRL